MESRDKLSTLLLETNNIQIPHHRKCQAIKKNGKPCRQRNRQNQGGGEIINGYCNYHKHLRKEFKEESLENVTTMN